MFWEIVAAPVLCNGNSQITSGIKLSDNSDHVPDSTHTTVYSHFHKDHLKYIWGCADNQRGLLERTMSSDDSQFFLTDPAY
jgi:hypothetical protein